MLIGTLVVSLLLCVGLALAVLYVVAAPHLRASDSRFATRLTERVDARVHRLGVLARSGAARSRGAAARGVEAAQRQLHARRGTEPETRSAQLHS
ncbi:hypothetical protein NUM3379_12720 [Kineococcus sp. NUM-3379]